MPFLVIFPDRQNRELKIIYHLAINLTMNQQDQAAGQGTKRKADDEVVVEKAPVINREALAQSYAPYVPYEHSEQQHEQHYPQQSYGAPQPYYAGGGSYSYPPQPMYGSMPTITMAPQPYYPAPPSSAPPVVVQVAPQSATAAKKAPSASTNKIVYRKAAGKSWEDTTLADWPENDFRIFVGDIGNEVNDEILKSAFAKYPSFQRSKVVRDPKSLKTKGYGFVSFSDARDYVKALREMNGKYIGNRPVKVLYCGSPSLFIRPLHV